MNKIRRSGIGYAILVLLIVFLVFLGISSLKGCQDSKDGVEAKVSLEKNLDTSILKKDIDHKIQEKALAEAEKIRMQNQIKEITEEVVAKKLEEVDRSKKEHSAMILDQSKQTKQKALDEADKIRLEHLLTEKVEAVLVKKLIESSPGIDESGMISDIEENKFTKAHVLKGIYFVTGSSRLTSASKRQLDVIARSLKQNHKVKIKIQGHTDNEGSHKINQRISLSRANAVKEALVKRGVAAGRIRTLGQGSDYPLADNKTELGRSTNRRVDISVFKLGRT